MKKKQANESHTKAPREQRTASFVTWDGPTLVLNILGTPGAKQNAIGKVKGTQLKVSVTATAEKGKATEHMVKFLAKEFGVSPAAITVVFGQCSIHKQLRIASPTKLPQVIASALESQSNERSVNTRG